MRILLALLLAATTLPAREPLPHRIRLPRGKQSVIVDVTTGKVEERKEPCPRPPAEKLASKKREVYLAPAGGRQQLFVRVPGKRTQLTRHELGCVAFRVRPHSPFVVYTTVGKSEVRMKATPLDLRVLDLETLEERVLLKGRRIGDFAISPDGELLAVGHSEQLDIFEISTGKIRSSRKSESIDKRLYSHGAYHLLWRPDSRLLACAIGFLGGRAAFNGEVSEPLYGDHELFLVPIDPKKKVEVVHLPKNVWLRPTSWVN